MNLLLLIHCTNFFKKYIMPRVKSYLENMEQKIKELFTTLF